MTTIGFGDVMPPAPGFILLSIVPFVGGLAMVAMVVSMLNAKVETIHRNTVDMIEENVLEINQLQGVTKTIGKRAGCRKA